MIKPQRLQKGDTSAILAPAGPVRDKNDLTKAKELLEDLGLKVILCKSCFEEKGYLSGSDELRAEDINKMFYSKEVRGIFCLRGGYGSQRLLERLDYKMIMQNPKVFVGYSDITALHTVFNQLGFVTYHGPMPGTGAALDNFTKESLVKNIFEDIRQYELKNPYDLSLKAINKGRAEGVLTGGNLSVLVSTLGTRFELDTRGKILFIEDVNEPPYKIDRMLLQLKYSSKLKQARGIILGSFNNCVSEPEDKSLSIKEIIDEYITPLNIPAISNLYCGHVSPTLTLPMGAYVILNADEERIIC